METLEMKISQAVECLQLIPNIKFDGDRWLAPSECISILEKYSIPYEEFGQQIIVLLKAFLAPAKLKYFPNLSSEIKADDIGSNLVIFDAGPTFISFDPTQMTCKTFGNENEKIVTESTNLIAYFQLFNHLKSSAFCDYYNASNNEIVIYNSSKGIQKIVFDTIPNIKPLGLIKENVKLLVEYASQLQFRLFFQNATFALSGSSGKISLVDMISKASDIISITQRDFQLVNKKFNFENFQDSLIKEKNKYFNSIRDVISKVGSQSIGIPISIGATVFTSYKVTGDVPLNMLVLLTFVLYVIFYIKIQLLYKRDIKEIKREFTRDFEMIKQKSGLDANVIEAEHNVIVKRIDKTSSLIFWLIFMIVGLAGIVTAFLLGQILLKEGPTIESAFPRLI
jgi:hypothetical protein